jgi:exodeoxyribonuclease VII large subunit
VASALEVAGNLVIDCVALIRGGGSRTDLAAFDSRQVAESVARFPVPVVTGLGHEIDQSIADQVAHTATKTPTQAAEFLVQRVRSSEQTLVALASGFQHASGYLLAAARSSLAGVEAALKLTGHRVRSQEVALSQVGELLRRAATRRLDLEAKTVAQLGARLAISAPRITAGSRQRLAGLGHRVADTTAGRLGRAGIQIEVLARLCSQLGPERTLARGFSITRDARGRVITAKGQVEVGDQIETETARGKFMSVVEESSAMESLAEEPVTARSGS